MYIHYGSKEYDPERFKPIENKSLRAKPLGGLWGSPMGAEYGWKACCERADFHLDSLKESFLFSLAEEANVVYINSVDDLVALPKVVFQMPEIEEWLGWVFLDFEKMLADGVDAIQLNLSNDENAYCPYRGLYHKLYGWDCDSILVMNKEVVVIL